jgi:hypothetical protein
MEVWGWVWEDFETELEGWVELDGEELIVEALGWLAVWNNGVFRELEGEWGTVFTLRLWGAEKSGLTGTGDSNPFSSRRMGELRNLVNRRRRDIFNNQASLEFGNL